MKFKLFLFTVIFVLIYCWVYSQMYDIKQQSMKRYTACYVCSDNRLVQFKGADSLANRKAVMSLYKCNVITTVEYCEQLKRGR